MSDKNAVKEEDRVKTDKKYDGGKLAQEVKEEAKTTTVSEGLVKPEAKTTTTVSEELTKPKKVFK